MYPQLNAVCILIIKDGKILGVSRKDNHNDFGLPGGKVDATDYLEDNPLAFAAKRELKEETGLDAKSLTPVFSAMCGKYMATTFLAEVHGDIIITEAGVVQWCDKEDIINGCFGEYHKEMFERVLV